MITVRKSMLIFDDNDNHTIVLREEDGMETNGGFYG